jgi:protein gp37
VTESRSRKLELCSPKRPDRIGELVQSKIVEVLPNVWLGTSIENADVAARADALRTVPAAIRFISFEPLTNPVSRSLSAGVHL